VCACVVGKDARGDDCGELRGDDKGKKGGLKVNMTLSDAVTYFATSLLL
jgi:hypothetical protein